MKYKIYADYGTTTEQLLHECNRLDDAIKWASGYIRYDFGGHDCIDVLEGDVIRWGLNAEIDA